MIVKNDSSKCAPRGFEIDVMRIVYKPDVTLSLEGAVNGSVASVERLDGVKNLTHTASPTTISGKPAERVSMTGDRTTGSNTRQIHLEGVYIADGQTFYQVVTVYDSTNAHGGEYATRTLQSVKLAQ
jgi:hypothetical protein